MNRITILSLQKSYAEKLSEIFPNIDMESSEIPGLLDVYISDENCGINYSLHSKTADIWFLTKPEIHVLIPLDSFWRIIIE